MEKIDAFKSGDSQSLFSNTYTQNTIDTILLLFALTLDTMCNSHRRPPGDSEHEKQKSVLGKKKRQRKRGIDNKGKELQICYKKLYNITSSCRPSAAIEGGGYLRRA